MDYKLVVENEEPVHQVLNLPEFGARDERARLLAAYSRCEVQDAERGVYSQGQLEYWSVYGKLCRDGHKRRTG